MANILNQLSTLTLRSVLDREIRASALHSDAPEQHQQQHTWHSMACIPDLLLLLRAHTDVHQHPSPFSVVALSAAPAPSSSWVRFYLSKDNLFPFVFCLQTLFYIEMH